jgi:hypothetical protein
MLKVISGAQTGADVAGLWMAKLCGIPTGGWAPKGFETLKGEHPEMAETFGIKEHSKGYRGRTIQNLSEADLTIICYSTLSAGSRLTIDQCKKLGKKHIIINFDPTDLPGSLKSPKVDLLISELSKAYRLGIDMTLNVAGNSSNNSARAFEFVFKMLHKVFTELGYSPTITTELGHKVNIAPSSYLNYQDKWK